MDEKSKIFDDMFKTHFYLSYSTHSVVHAMAEEMANLPSRSMYERMKSTGMGNLYVKDGYVQEADYYDLEEGIFGAMIIYVALGDLKGNIPHLLAKLNWSSPFNEKILKLYSMYGQNKV